MATQRAFPKPEFIPTPELSFPVSRFSAMLPYVIAALCVTASILIREILNLHFGMNLMAGTFFPSVLVAALIGGWPVGLFATALSTILLWYVVTPPHFSFLAIDYPDFGDLIAFFVINLIVTGLASNHRRLRLRAEADKRHIEFTLRESTHRVKNILSVIQGMSKQIAKRYSDPHEFQDAFYERLDSLAKSHDLLVSRRWSAVDLRDLITAQITTFGTFGEFELSGEAVRLNPTATEQIGLALYELAANSVKYGAWKQGGRVSVHWRPAGSALEITWQENGAKPATRNDRNGFGKFMLLTVVPRTLLGSAEWLVRKDGISWRLSVHSTFFERASDTFTVQG